VTAAIKPHSATGYVGLYKKKLRYITQSAAEEQGFRPTPLSAAAAATGRIWM